MPMLSAVSVTSWLQLAGTLVAAAAAVASWAAVVQARRSAEEARQAERESMLPVLLVSPTILTPGAGHPTMGVSIYNAGGGIAQNVAVLLVAEDAFGRHIVTFLRPGETVTFGSDLDATDSARAVVYGRSADNRDFVWNADNYRRELPGGASPMPSWETIFGAFYSTQGLDSMRPGQLLRGDSRLY
jgi:hypothetical protein